MVGVYPIAKILTLKGTRRLVSLAQNDKTTTCAVFQWADVGICPYWSGKRQFYKRGSGNIPRILIAKSAENKQRARVSKA